MKKYLVVLFLITVSTVQIFAMEIIPKVGWVFSPHINFQNNGGDKSWNSPEGTFSYGGDILFRIWGKLYLGPGVMFSNSHKIQDINDLKFNFTNVYLEAKLKFDIKHKDSVVTLYPFINVGGCFLSYDNMPKENEIGDYVDAVYVTNCIKNRECTGDFYYALGCGIEYKSFVLELLYGVNLAHYSYECVYRRTLSTSYLDSYAEYNKYEHHDITYSAFKIQLGYKFLL